MEAAKPVVHELKELPLDAHLFAQVVVRQPLKHVRISFPTLSAHVANPLLQNEQVTAKALREIPTAPITTVHIRKPQELLYCGMCSPCLTICDDRTHREGRVHTTVTKEQRVTRESAALRARLVGLVLRRAAIASQESRHCLGSTQTGPAPGHAN